MSEINELIQHLVSWQALTSYMLVVLVFGFFPGFVLGLLVRLYPKGDERRRVLLADMYELPRRERWFFVAEQFETVLREAAPARMRQLRLRWQRRGLVRHVVSPDVMAHGSWNYPQSVRPIGYSLEHIAVKGIQGILPITWEGELPVIYVQPRDAHLPLLMEEALRAAESRGTHRLNDRQSPRKEAR